MTIHWRGTGLSAVPGLRRPIETGHPVTVWNRTDAKAREAVGDLTDDSLPFDIDAPSDPKLVERHMDSAQTLAQHLDVVDHLS